MATYGPSLRPCTGPGGSRGRSSGRALWCSVLPALCGLLLVGCDEMEATRYPIVSVTDPSVYTPLHIYAARRQLPSSLSEPGKSQEVSDMDRYFRTKKTDYSGQCLRMDDMLDQTQRITEMLNIYDTMLRLNLRLTPGQAEVPELDGTKLIDWAVGYADDPNVRREANRAKEARNLCDQKKAELKEAIGKREEALQKAVNDVKRAEDAKVAAATRALDEAKGEWAGSPSTLSAVKEAQKAADADVAACDEAVAQAQARKDEVAARKTRCEAELNQMAQERSELQALWNTAGETERQSLAPKVAAAEEQLRSGKDKLKQATLEAVRLTEEEALCVSKRSQALRVQTVANTRLTEVQGLARDVETRQEQLLTAENARTAAVEAAKTRVTGEHAAKIAQFETDIKNAQKSAETAEAAAQAAIAKVRGPLQQLRPQLLGLVADSPVDRLDRAHNFFNAYMLKTLLAGDSRAVTPAVLYDRLKDTGLENLCSQIKGKGEPDYRLLLFVFQVHIDAGDMANTMAGVRIHITGVTPDRDSNGQPYSPADVKVLRLHPTRSYDIDDRLMLEKMNSVLDIGLAGTDPGSGVGAAGSVTDRKMAETRRNYLLRVSKSASVGDAGRSEFGWNFYPTNLQTRSLTLAQWVYRFTNVIGRVPMTLQAFLEPGARDCSAYLLIPRGVASVTFTVDYILQGVDAEVAGRESEGATRYHITQDGERIPIRWIAGYSRKKKESKPQTTFVVKLPPYHEAETAALTLSPTRGMAAR